MMPKTDPLSRPRHAIKAALLLALVAFVTFTLKAQEPSLILSLDDFKARLAVANAEPWAKADLEHLLHQADAYPESYEKQFGLHSVELPPQGGQWLHWYVCPDTGTELKFRPPNHNVCPDNGKEYPGLPYDQVVYQMRNDALHGAAVALGLAYRLTGKERYAKEAADLLRSYADTYGKWALHDNNGKESPNGARAYSQTLDESIWLIDIAWSYDLIRGSGELTPEQKQHIERDLLRASYQTVSKAHKEPTDNIQSWINAAIAAVGYTLNDAGLIHEALDGPIGFRYQMHHFVRDGFWVEGSLSYQFYAMRALTLTAQMAKRGGTDLWKEEPALLSLFKGPVALAFPNGELPAFNDAKPSNLNSQSAQFEIAYAATEDRDLLPVITAKGRTSTESLLFGVKKLPNEAAKERKSVVFKDAGIGVLRDQGDDFQITTKFGEHGGSHGHFDKLGFVLFANGQVQGIDPGTQLYGSPLHRDWDSETIAHNTISVDETVQTAATGQLLDWQTGSGWSLISMDAGPVYSSANLRRTILLTNEYAILVDDARSLDGKSHVYDWAYHNSGREDVLGHLAMAPFSQLPPRNGYNHLEGTMAADTSANILVRFSLPESTIKSSLLLHMLGQPSTLLVTGTGPGQDSHIKVPFLIARRKGIEAHFVTLLTPVSSISNHLPLTLQQLTPDSFRIKGEHFVDTLTLGSKLPFQRSPK